MRVWQQCHTLCFDFNIHSPIFMTLKSHPIDIHPLSDICVVDIQPPRQFTYPFCYEPHPLCMAAARQVQQYIEESGVWQGEQSCGKMFGVLVVKMSDSSYGFLAAYSGLLAGRNDWEYFVPPVFDAQQPDGHFKVEERAISAINKEIEALEKSDAYQTQLSMYESTKQTVDLGLEQMRCRVAEAKQQRDARRREAEQNGQSLTADEKAMMIRESQHLKAEQRRLRQQCEAMLAELHKPIEEHKEHVAALRRRRREMSDELQQWLFSQYRMLNALGEERNLIDIFRDTVHAVPPAGSGDCCAPKLLQYAYKHGLHPVCMAEFWWGESPRQEIRHHLHYYPACRSKCLPILTHMLQGLDVEANPLAQPKSTEKPSIIYEDDYIMVVNKPAGMLSVPGKKDSENDNLSIEEYFALNSTLNTQHSASTSPQSTFTPHHPAFLKAVHRLDMDTSGLLVLAKTDEAYVELQRQFASREVKKRYEAVLDGKLADIEGRISLPLIADIMDRPRQHVDFDSGKPAITDWHVERSLPDGRTLVHLYPLTGRTHQLRVHCAHAEGIACPILGDPLYGHGTRATRMYLHAAMVEFSHPVTGERMRFESPSGF